MIFELSLLTSALSKLNINNHDIDKLFNELNKVNLKLWEIEDKIREKEIWFGSFDEEFIELQLEVFIKLTIKDHK